MLLVYYKRRTLSMGLWNQVDFELEFQLEVYKLFSLQQAIQHWQWPKCKPFNFICHILVSQKKKSIRKIAWNITLSLNIWCECFVLYLVNFYSHFYCACFSHFFFLCFFFAIISAEYLLESLAYLDPFSLCGVFLSSKASRFYKREIGFSMKVTFFVLFFRSNMYFII